LRDSLRSGGLAKCRNKIEHERVVRNDLGRAVLEALVSEGILRRDPRLYHVDADQLAAKLGITWQELRQHESSRLLEAFLRRAR
jgi:hypothetical protein